MGVIRVLPESEIEALLQHAVIARLACCSHDGDGRPFLVPLPCFYAGEALYALTGPGTKLRMMRANPLVTIEVDAGEASDRWKSVIAEGVFEELVTPDDQRKAMAIITAATGETPELGAHSTLFRIRLTAKSGRYELPT
jgi:nitroimidazol reductase NimA-like FMN-containing flavoprotein (pyridoxamine 5'-phosphate oxidase superfamily)